MKAVSFAALVVVGSTSAIVRAGSGAEPRDLRAFENRPIGIAGHVGIFAPIGWGGGSLELAPTRFLVVSGGVGGNADGMQMMVSLRGRLPASRSTAVTVEAIGARGPRRWESSSHCDWFCSSQASKTKEWDASMLAGGAVGLEHLEDGFLVRVYVGLAGVMNKNDARCRNGTSSRPLFGSETTVTTDTLCGDDDLSSFFLGGSLGYAFEL